MFRAIAPAIGLAALAVAMFPAKARAQVNIDQGKSPAEIYSSDCATCHKTPRGLAAGKNVLTLSAFLREHYTASRDQASAIAAYVLGAGGAEPAPRQKPEVEHARAEAPKSEAPKSEASKSVGTKSVGTKAVGAKSVGAKSVGTKGEPKAATHPTREAARPEEPKRPKQEAAKPAEAKRPKQEEAKREERPGPANVERDEVHPETASRGEKSGPEETAPAARQPAPVVATPAVGETPNTAETPNPVPNLELGSTTMAATPAEEGSSAGATVPRDNIPD